LELEQERTSFPDCKIVYCVEQGAQQLSNAVFLLGAYMILRHDVSADAVPAHFAWLESRMQPHRDVSTGSSEIDLDLIDHWHGLDKGKAQGWVRYAPSGSYMWGAIDIDEYSHYANPANGSLHQIVPGKLVALPGPRDLGGAEWRDDANGGRLFSPAFYAPILHDMGVKAVVRLGATSDYSSDAFEGLPIHDLPFEEDCPPLAVVQRFIRVVETTPGAVAVHCQSGLGRTGTLAALHLMLSRGFKAQEAIGWLRIMRPGSVVGRQQQYLCALSDAIDAASRARGVAAPLTPAPSSRPAITSLVVGRAQFSIGAVHDKPAASAIATPSAPVRRFKTTPRTKRSRRAQACCLHRVDEVEEEIVKEETEDADSALVHGS
jgi:cell division cycle 14